MIQNSSVINMEFSGFFEFSQKKDECTNDQYKDNKTISTNLLWNSKIMDIVCGGVRKSKI